MKPTTKQEVEAWIAAEISQKPWVVWMAEEWSEKTKHSQAELLAAIDGLVERALAMLKPAGFSAYETTKGKKVVVRFKVKMEEGIVTIQDPGGRCPGALCAIMSVCPRPALTSYCSGSSVATMVRDFAIAKLVAEIGPEVQARMDAALSAMAPSDRARQQAEKNVRNAEAARRRAAMERLSLEMRRYDFTKEDVVEAWELSQVEKVQQS